ncbi:hypothetical protein HMPREF1249_0168 [Jonquetella sp. BV3C21]|nr:hypothetical protein GCWU000246_00122 [Jonquetella anthropi E3_33 E1]ERL23747.1 hypothetical protein HMPREF1249_0168 [Jonquetella sp. BV3C21]
MNLNQNLSARGRHRPAAFGKQRGETDKKSAAVGGYWRVTEWNSQLSH